MRKTISTSKNNITGETISVEKLKPVSNVRGVHTIELFDESGNVVKEVVSENFISPLMYKQMQQYSILPFFTERTVHSSVSNNSYYNYDSFMQVMYGRFFLESQDVLLNSIVPSQSSNYDNGHLFKYLLLTTDNSPESPETETLLKGNVIGFAERELTYIGTDTMRGSINRNDSYIEAGHAHLVYDFPTSAANGTFNSIAWARNISGNGKTEIAEKIGTVTAPEGHEFNLGKKSGAHGIKVKGDSLFLTTVNSTDNKKKGIVKYTLLNNEYVLESFAEIAFTNEVLLTDFDFNSSETVIYTVDGGNELRAWSYPEGVAQNLPNGAEFYKIGNSIDYPAGRSVAILKDKFIFVTGEQSSSLEKSVYMDMATGAITTFLSGETIMKSSGNHICNIDVDEENNLVTMYGQYSYDQNNNSTNPMNDAPNRWTWRGTCGHVIYALNEDGTLGEPVKSAAVNDARRIPGHIPNTTIQGPFIHNNSLTSNTSYEELCSRGETIKWDIAGSQGYGILRGAVTRDKKRQFINKVYYGSLASRNLLPEPITKTSANTMKISYDLYFE